MRKTARSLSCVTIILRDYSTTTIISCLIIYVIYYMIIYLVDGTIEVRLQYPRYDLCIHVGVRSRFNGYKLFENLVLFSFF